MRSHIKKWNDNKNVYSLSNKTYQSYINPVDKMASSAENIFSRRKTNALWSVATKVTLAVSGALLLVGALFTSPAIIVGGALLAGATITVIAFRAGFDKTEKNDKRDATEIRDQLSNLFPPITIPSSNPEFV